jgi:hypothetical protein
MERRKNNRYRLGVPVTFLWWDARKTEHEGLGLTRDLSSTAAFVLTTTPPPLQAHIKLDAFFTPAIGSAAHLRIHGEGKVVRVEPIEDDEACAGFAIVSRGLVMRREEDYQ